MCDVCGRRKDIIITDINNGLSHSNKDNKVDHSWHGNISTMEGNDEIISYDSVNTIVPNIKIHVIVPNVNINSNPNPMTYHTKRVTKESGNTMIYDMDSIWDVNGIINSK